MEYAELNQLRRAHARAHGEKVTNALIAAHGGTDGLDSVPGENIAALAEALEAGDTTSHSRGHAHGSNAIPKSLDEIAPAAWARFNNPPKRKRES
jgi:hypothetical protein